MEKDKRLAKFLFRVFESHDPKDPVSLWTDIIYILIIGLSAIFTILEVTEIWDKHILMFEIIEYIMAGFFFIEWVGTYIAFDVEYPDLPYVKRKLKWVFSFESIIDILCLTILILTLILEEHFDSIRYLDLVVLLKLLRLNKLFKYRHYINPNLKKEVHKHD